MKYLDVRLPLFLIVAVIVGVLFSYALEQTDRTKDKPVPVVEPAGVAWKAERAVNYQALPSVGTWLLSPAYYEQLKQDDPIAWAVTQPLSVKPWRELHRQSILAERWQEWEFTNGPRLVKLLEAKYGDAFLTPFYVGRNGQYITADNSPPHGIRCGTSAGILFHVLASQAGKKPETEEW